MDRIKFYSALFRKLFHVLSVAYPLMLLLIWLSFDYLPSELQTEITPAGVKSITWNTTTLCLSVLCALPLAYIARELFLALAKLFGFYTRGDVFHKECCFLIHRVAKFLVLWVVYEILANPCYSYTLTFQNPPGQGLIQATLSTGHVTWLILAGVVWILSKIQAEAALLTEESHLTI